MPHYHGIALFNPNTGRWHSHALAPNLRAAEGLKAALMCREDYGQNAALESEVRIHDLGAADRPEKALGLLLDACKADNGEPPRRK
jgi:hypothetical protein